MRAGKGTTWEGGMREPTIFWAPERISPGIIDKMGSTMDIFNTFSNIAGVSLPEDRILDLNQDPSEQYNIALQHPDILQAMKNLVMAHQEKMIPGEDQLKNRGGE